MMNKRVGFSPLQFDSKRNLFLLYSTINYGIIFSAERTVAVMPNIKPVSDLRNYTEVLRDISVGEPVFLTKNGRGKYAIVDIEEYEKTQAVIKLMGELTKGERSGKENGWTDIAEVERLLGADNG